MLTTDDRRLRDSSLSPSDHDPEADTTTRPAEPSFSRGLRVMLAFAGGARRTMGDVAQELELPLSTVYRYVRELKHFRLVEEIDSGIYAAGPSLLGLALGAPLHEQFRLHGEPILRRLVAQTGETAILGVRVGTSILVVAQVESPQAMRLSFTSGTLRPLSAGASATALLAFESNTVIDQVLAEPLQPITEYTIVDRQILRGRLAQIRADGYAFSSGEVDLFASAVAAPVLYRGRVLCALSVAGPSARFTPARVGTFAVLVQAAARTLSSLLASQPGGTA